MRLGAGKGAGRRVELVEGTEYCDAIRRDAGSP